MRTSLWGLVSLALGSAATSKKPNVVYIVTDDQDQMLGGSFPEVEGMGTPLPKTKRLLVDEGATFSNAFIHVPICNPSRSTTLTGRYFHNVKTTNVSWAAMHVNMDIVHNASFGLEFQRAGYATALIGKYVNAMPDYVPLGWDAWLANGGGSYLGPTFFARGAPGVADGPARAFPADAYTVAVVGNASVAFLEETLGGEKPVLLYCAPKAAHEPFDPPPWYAGHWDPKWPKEAPRGPAWNATRAARGHHAANVPTQPMISARAATVVDGVFRNRWRTLMAVDDLVEALVSTVEAEGATDRTYFVYTSDHGFQLGQLNMLMDKRHVYDWDTRVPLVIKGPGIARQTRPEVVTNVDLAPTLAALAGLERKIDWDGRSLDGLLAPGDDRGRPWRTSVLIEYYFNDENRKCVSDCAPVEDSYPAADSWCVGLSDAPNTGCWGPNPNGGGCVDSCYATENSGNNFIGLRKIDGPLSLLYAAYQNGSQSSANISFDAPDFHELFDTAADPWCTTNAYETADGGARAALDDELAAWFRCAGADCP